MGNGQHRLNVDLQCAVTLAGHRYHCHALLDCATELVRVAEQQQLRGARGENLLGGPDDCWLSAGTADPAAKFAVRGDDRARAGLAGGWALSPDDGSEREGLAPLRQLRGLLKDLPAVHVRQ